MRLVHEAVSGYGKPDSNLGRSPTVGKMLSNIAVCSREIGHESKSPQT